MTAKHKLTANLIGAMLLYFSSAQLRAATPVHYSCPASEKLSVLRDGSSARVTFGGQHYLLRRRQSNIGEKYISSNAALIIDGASAVFVANDHPDLGTCTKGVPVAFAR